MYQKFVIISIFIFAFSMNGLSQKVLSGKSTVGTVNIGVSEKPSIIWVTPSPESTSTNLNEIKFNIISRTELTVLVNGVKINKVKSLDIRKSTNKVHFFHIKNFLASGENRIHIVAKNTTGLSEIERVVKYSKPIITNSVPGKNYALIIGVSSYLDTKIPDLKNLPTIDATRLGNLLQSDYGFDSLCTKVLINPTRNEIVKQFNFLQKQANTNDNVLIFYAGHGYYEKKYETGYWLPADSETENSANWLYNSQIVSDIRRINARHVLLISDACFSGSIFSSRDIFVGQEVIEQLSKKKSREAFTSGALETVPNKSFFFKYLIETLENPGRSSFTAHYLFSEVKRKSVDNAPNIPQFGQLPGLDDQGGSFIFRKVLLESNN